MTFPSRDEILRASNAIRRACPYAIAGKLCTRRAGHPGLCCVPAPDKSVWFSPQGLAAVSPRGVRYTLKTLARMSREQVAAEAAEADYAVYLTSNGHTRRIGRVVGLSVELSR